MRIPTLLRIVVALHHLPIVTLAGTMTNNHQGGQLDFLAYLKPRPRTIIATTRPGLVRHIRERSLIFGLAGTKHVLPELDKHLTSSLGWRRLIIKPHQYVVFRRKETNVIYMTARVYESLIRMPGEQTYRISTAGCIVQYYRLRVPIRAQHRTAGHLQIEK